MTQERFEDKELSTMRPVLRRGDEGEWVARLQRALVEAGLDPGPVDGVLGPRTEQAVLALQSGQGLDVDGVVGPATWDALNVAADDPVDGPVEPVGADPVDWTAVDGTERLRYVMALLVERYGYPAHGAAGLVGNLWAESGVLPNRVEGSAAATPMRARGFGGEVVDFSAAEVMDRDRATGVGPFLPGVGLAQWTSQGRRNGLFTHGYDGRVPGEEVLTDMDAQVDYLVHELRTGYPGVQAVVADAAVLVEDACDEVVYRFEVPGSVLEAGTRLPRTDPRVQRTFEERRAHARRALSAYEDRAGPSPPG